MSDKKDYLILKYLKIYLFFFEVLKKMQTEFSDPVKYYLIMQNDFLQLNQLIGRELSFAFESYECLNCGLDKKIFRQGFCYDCFSSSAKVGDWIIRPELSTAHLGHTSVVNCSFFCLLVLG